jgi:hypothetical protein
MVRCSLLKKPSLNFHCVICSLKKPNHFVEKIKMQQKNFAALSLMLYAFSLLGGGVLKLLRI